MTIHLKHQHHRNIVELLRCMSASLLEQTQCYFGGGTAIVMELGEYRLSDDIDLLCASAQGYRTLRNTITHDSLAIAGRRPPHSLAGLAALPLLRTPCTGAGRKSSAVTYFNKKRLDSFTPHS